MVKGHRLPDTADALREKAAYVAGLAEHAQDVVAFQELETLSVLYLSDAAELDVTSSIETPDSLRSRASEVHVRANRMPDQTCKDALRAIADRYLSAALKLQSASNNPAIREDD